ncbi:hypothetical protein BO94DRAFT_500610 [Aspergillus sclerotioniger CBS 115572]|uniref:ACB domain-containing protein n=1 Tax=Aspergillus sclerotioniger CBS 115572 TaxID=1450535 RepID=A0A317VJA2_9EURO|nr:hypothetical protein BO94DRAFT_500610 [Aspergillus sclerotioniger CBS 115572]PWY73098.1 hypothetical protein BO94DRAFT_500610 [Aspergillus sclerotioniger CBS 115572]
MSDSVDRVFVHALNTVKRIPRTGTARPPASERLKLYGLYKQSMEGDVEGVMDRPVGNTADVYMECEKWDAWYAQRDLSRTEAKRRYISTLIETMHNYASQTAEARELVAELEFVWDQIKSSPSSLSSQELTSHGSDARVQSSLTRPEYEQLLASARGDSRLRVLSPVSQPEGGFRRQMEEQRDGGEEEEEEEVYAEAQDNLFENEEEDNEHEDHDRDEAHEYQHQSYNLPDREGSDRHHSHHSHHEEIGERRPPVDDRRWRRRVEQALTKMTAEIAAVREQMEARALAHRRRSSIWAWLKWLVWVTARQIVVDLALLGMLLVWMRMRGDRRLEEKLKVGWTEVKSRLARWRVLRRVSTP